MEGKAVPKAHDSRVLSSWKCVLGAAVALTGGCTNYTRVASVVPADVAQAMDSAELGEYEQQDVVLIARSSGLKKYRDADYSGLLDRMRTKYESVPDVHFPYTEDYLRKEFVGATVLWQRNFIVLVKGVIALVPREIEGTEPWATRTDWKASFGDLVAARPRPDGLVAVTRVLCDNDRHYETCASAYALGAYDASTGQGLDTQERRIDVSTFRVVGDAVSK